MPMFPRVTSAPPLPLLSRFPKKEGCCVVRKSNGGCGASCKADQLLHRGDPWLVASAGWVALTGAQQHRASGLGLRGAGKDLASLRRRITGSAEDPGV